jgi:NAD(P)-dependent dehydrogenase (short-subunit alcohol dehydrogenase family)
MDIRSVVDDALEVSVVASFSRLGPAIRRRLHRWQAPPPDALIGRTALVTGPTSGIGRVAAEALAALGARVILVGRSEERLRDRHDELVARHGEDRFPIVVADMGSLRSVRAAAETVLATEDRLDVLVDNAGAIYPERIEGPDGIEATLAILAVGPFVLVGGLLPLLRRTPDPRVIAVTSGGMYTQAVDLSDLDGSSRPFSGPRAYARAKRVQVALVREWARRTPGHITFVSMHPGWADTPGLADQLPGFYRVMRPLLRTPSQGADTIVWLATTSLAPAWNGRLFLDRRVRPFDRLPATRLSASDRRRLWDIVVGLTGVPDPAPAVSQGWTPNSRLRADLAAHTPHMPWTPPPGGVDDEQRYSPRTGVE